MDKRRCRASVRTIVEYALLSGSLVPGSQLSRMREGMLGHTARQQAATDAQTEVTVRSQVEGEIAILEVSGRIDVLLERDGLPVVEEIKLAPAGDAPEMAAPVHRAQALCYGHMLAVPEAIIRVLYVRVDGSEVASFEERLDAAALEEAFLGYALPYLARMEERLSWMDLRDDSIRALPFPFDTFRTGQREMAVQVFWAIKSRRRLFAQAPTGTGKTAAALYPALKALTEGHSGQLFYLTARTTAQQNAAQAIARMRAQGLRIRVLTLTAKEKICPHVTEGPWRCDMLGCPHAEGFYDRLGIALADMRGQDDWTREAVEAVAEKHRVCPFEFGLSLAEEADVILCDYNYAFDPGARLRRIFQWTTNVTLLVDEAHNLPDRAREMLSAVLDSRALREIRRTVGKLAGRKGPLYQALTALITLVEAQPEGETQALPEGLGTALEGCMEAALAVVGEIPLGDLTRVLAAALGTLERFHSPEYVVLCSRHGKQHANMMLFCLDPAPHLVEVTRKLRGVVYFSATLTPLSAWRTVIGGVEEDGLLSLPSPFPKENLLVLRHPVATRYRDRERTVGGVAEAILTLVNCRAGNYLACFPSYAYLRQVLAVIESNLPETVTLHVQRGGMNDEDRAAYLEAFVPRAQGALLGMVVLGGVFGEGVDLPGERLSGVAVVGVGLPQVGPERELLRRYYDGLDGTGFAQAYRYPGMNKVLQAVGRVIRTATDQGVALLIDDRFTHQEYAVLMPPWWDPAEVVPTPGTIHERLEAFWQCCSTT